MPHRGLQPRIVKHIDLIAFGFSNLDKPEEGEPYSLHPEPRASTTGAKPC